MLKTPTDFSATAVAQAHDAPLNFVFRGDELLVRNEDLSLPDAFATALLGLQRGQFQPLGLLSGQYCQTAWLPRSAVAPDGYAFRKLRALFGAMDDARMAIAGRAFQISDWARTHQFCGACGSPKQQMQGERCMRCAACGHLAYPRISPAMMVLIRRGHSILLARNALSPARFFSALAGFVEAGESIEETIHREVAEEVGLKVRDIRYFGSQPWPFPNSLMIAYTAEYDSGEIHVDENEIAEARWFGPGDALPPLPPAGISIAGALIQANLP
jgi:NAD+ diphosphatase